MVPWVHNGGDLDCSGYWQDLAKAPFQWESAPAKLVRQYIQVGGLSSM